MNKIVSLSILIAMSSIVMGCDQKVPETKEPQANQQSTPQPSTPANQQSITIQHPNGETIIMKNPQRIVTMDFATLDTLDKLNLADNVVGLPKGNLPEYLNQFDQDKYANTGNMKEPNLDVIRDLKPDLILITGRQSKSYAQLAEIAPTINLGIDSKNYQASFTHNAEVLGALFDKQDAVKEETELLNQKITKLKTKAQGSNLTGLVILHNDNKLGSANTSGYATLVHDIIGLKRADTNTEPKRQAADDAYLTAVNPDIIFIIDRSAAIGQKKFDIGLLDSEGIKATPAYKNDKIIYLTPDLWYLSGGGLESLSLQLDEINDALD